MATNVANVIEKCYEVLNELLSPACVANGISLKNMPDDGSTGAMRNAMAILFVPSASTEGLAKSISTRQTGVANVGAYVIILAASQVGPRSATWVAKIVTEALNGKQADHGRIKVFANSVQFTSFQNGLWQYRLMVDIQIPISSISSDQTEVAPNKTGSW